MDDADEAGDEAGDETGAEAHEQPRGATGPEVDFRALAEDWIAIWQSEITAYLTDPETQQAWGALMAIWAGAAQTMMSAVPPAPGFGAAGTRRRGRANPGPGRDTRSKPGAAQSSGADAATGTAPAAAAPVDRGDEVRRLEQRVAELERQLADQERRRGATGENRRARRASRPRG